MLQPKTNQWLTHSSITFPPLLRRYYVQNFHKIRVVDVSRYETGPLYFRYEATVNNLQLAFFRTEQAQTTSHSCSHWTRHLNSEQYTTYKLTMPCQQKTTKFPQSLNFGREKILTAQCLCIMHRINKAQNAVQYLLTLLDMFRPSTTAPFFIREPGWSPILRLH